MSAAFSFEKNLSNPNLDSSPRSSASYATSNAFRIAETIFFSLGFLSPLTCGEPSSVKVRFELLACRGLGGVTGREVGSEPSGVKVHLKLLACGELGGVAGMEVGVTRHVDDASVESGGVH